MRRPPVSFTFRGIPLIIDSIYAFNLFAARTEKKYFGMQGEKRERRLILDPKTSPLQYLLK